MLGCKQNLRIVFNALEGSYALCLLANIVQLASIEREEVLKEFYYPSFTVRIFDNLSLYISIF